MAKSRGQSTVPLHEMVLSEEKGCLVTRHHGKFGEKVTGFAGLLQGSKHPGVPWA